MPALPKLKQELFCNKYIECLGNGTKAATAAGYSAATAVKTASKLLLKTDIQERIRELRGEVAIRLDVSKDKIIQKIAEIAFGTAKDFYDEEGNLIPIHKLSDAAAASLSGFDIEEVKGWDEELELYGKIGIVKKIKRESKHPYFDLLCEVLGYKAARKIEQKTKTGTTKQPVIFNW